MLRSLWWDAGRRGVKAFTDYSPVTYSRARGIYRSVRWGRNLELFFLDARSFRDAYPTPRDQETFLSGSLDQTFERLLAGWLMTLICGVLFLEWTIRRLHKLA